MQNEEGKKIYALITTAVNGKEKEGVCDLRCSAGWEKATNTTKEREIQEMSALMCLALKHKNVSRWKFMVL